MAQLYILWHSISEKQQMVQAARQTQENNDIILILVTATLKIFEGITGFQKDTLYTDLQ